MKAKGLYDEELETGEEIVARLKKEYMDMNDKNDSTFLLYPFLTGALMAYYNSLLYQIKVMQDYKNKIT